ncbi:MAG: nucleotide exchange factor GrpE [Lachnospiraceae bacterium]|nr:nucleotide exchange factor GrpE [Lachnospiraceae bacterium]
MEQSYKKNKDKKSGEARKDSDKTERKEESKEEGSKKEKAKEEKTSEDAAPEEDSKESDRDSGGEAEEKASDEDKKEEPAGKKDKKDAVIAELNDKVMRQMAEFENFRKRTEKEKAQMFDMGAKAILEKILPVVDNFERGLAAVPEDGPEDPFAEGMRMVYKQLTTSLEQAGLEPIEAVGQTFDPEIHNAVMHIDDDNYGESEITEELQKGYKYHDSVVRHSMVKVAN